MALAALPSRLSGRALELAKLNAEVDKFTVDTINHLKSLRLRIDGLEGAGGPFTGLATVEPSQINPNQVGAIGTSTRAAREDHVHDPRTGPPNQGIGGSNAEGNNSTLARSDHDHLLRETSGPTDMAIGNLFTGDLMLRSAGALIGRTVKSNGTSANQTSTSTSAADVAGTDFALPKAGEYYFFMISQYNTAAATTALQVSFTYSGTLTSGILRGMIQVNATTFEHFTTTAAATLVQAANGGGYAVGGQNGLVLVWCRVVVSTAGTFRLRFASEVGGSQVLLNSALLSYMVEM